LIRSVCFHFTAIVLAVAVCAQADTTEQSQVDALAIARSDLAKGYSAKLAELATWCDSEKLPEQAARVRSWLVSPEPVTLHLFVIPAESDPPPVADAPANMQKWHERFQSVRHAQAESLFELARQAIAQHRGTLAYELVVETARENPDHEAARRILGYQRVENAWLTPFEISKLKEKKVWHERFGWLASDRVSRYEAGERFNVPRKWITAEEDARLHATIDRPWEIVTEHYQVRTNHSLEEGVRLAARLERLYRVWQQLFVSYWATEPQLARWFDGGTPEARLKRQLKVVYYRNRDEYIAALKPRQPRIEITTGYYEEDQQTVHFFAGSDEGDSNVYHEATHQLFNETRPVARGNLWKTNFWAVEGIACYMESLTERDGICRLGGVDAIRLRDARSRLIDDRFYVPLAELVTIGRAKLQSDQRISMIYSESSGLTYFLMHAEAGRYREALVDYLLAIYTGHDTTGSLAELTGEAYSELDLQYREFIRSLKP
jgi:hypothetical protein